MPLRPARRSDLHAISAVLAAGFWDEEVVGDIMHPHRRQYPHDYAEYWHRKVREIYWSWSHALIVSYEMKEEEEEEGGGQAEVITGVADWERKGKGWEGVWGLRSRWDLRNITPLLHHYYHRLISSTLYPNRAADPAELDLEDRLAPFVAGFWSSAHRSDCWHLNHLSVAPEHQSQGYGRALVKWGLERAAADSVAASVICAAGKDRFYRQCGFGIEVGRATDGVGNPLRGRVDGGVVLFKDVGAACAGVSERGPDRGGS